MSGEQNLCHAIRFIFRLLKHRKLIRPYRLKFVHAGLQVPTRKISAKASRKCSRTESAYRSSLPVAIVNVSGAKRRFRRACILQRLPDRPPPRRFWNFIGEARQSNNSTDPEQAHSSKHSPTSFHQAS